MGLTVYIAALAGAYHIFSPASVLLVGKAHVICPAPRSIQACLAFHLPSSAGHKSRYDTCLFPDAGISIIAWVLSREFPPTFFPVLGLAEPDADGYQIEILPSLQVPHAFLLGMRATSVMAHKIIIAHQYFSPQQCSHSVTILNSVTRKLTDINDLYGHDLKGISSLPADSYA